MNKGGALPHRKEFIDVSYVKGVFDEEGREVIRPMTEDEKAWLDKFNAETESISPKLNQEIRQERSRYNEIKKELTDIIDDNPEDLAKQAMLKEELKQQKGLIDALLKEEGNLYPSLDQIKQFQKRDYDRKNDIYTLSKSQGKLVSLDLTEYDRFVTEEEPDAEILEQLIIPKKRPKKFDLE